MNFTAKTVIFALCAFFLFGGQLFAASASNDGCHKMNGCSTGDSYNAAPFNDPTYSPSWTEVTTSGRVNGGDYLRFSVVEGEIYQWSTEGKEDVFTGDYSKSCVVDTECAAGYEITAGVGLRCIGGYCLLPFDTELTLIDGTACSNTANFLAYSNSDGYRNQSQLEWKATFTGSVVLLVTNYEAQTTAGGAYTGEFKECQKTSGNMNTTVKWRRTSSEHCDVCGVSSDFKLSGGNAAKADNVATAPSWTSIQDYGATNYTDADLDSWIKPGSYITFEVKENQIYRWSTCKSAIHDTQLTLFKGTVNNAGEEDACGDFLAYGDDSEVSYVENGNTYCPVGTKQTVLEWQSNFNGKVTLLFSEYNCYQCAPQKNPVTGDNNWLSCFDTTVGTYQATVNAETGEKTVVTDSDGFPVVAASSCNPALPDSPCVIASYIYTYPLHWQRYDCQGCEGMQSGAEIVDSEVESSDNFAEGGSITLDSKKYASFSLKRGSKYLFKSNSSTSIITIRQGNGCGGRTLAQGTGQLAYFANSDDYDDDEGTFGPDLVSVYISDSDCNPNGHTLTYSYYTDNGDVKSRFKITKYGSDVVVTDNTTQLQFADTGEWVDSWQKAINKCREYSVGGGDGNVLKCPERVCPSPQSNYDNIAGGDFCRFKGASVQCQPPVCGTNYDELKKRVAVSGTTITILNPEEEDSWGKCYYSGSNCDRTETVQTSEIIAGPSDPNSGCRKPNLIWGTTHYKCDDGYVWTGDGDEPTTLTMTQKKCCKCDDGYVMNDNKKCVKYATTTECLPAENQICVGREYGCNEGIVTQVCPEGSEELSDGRCLTDEDEGYNVYSELNSISVTEYDLPEKIVLESCPAGTTDNGSGYCEREGCFGNVYSGNITSFGSYSSNVWYDSANSAVVPQCYQDRSTSSATGPCCCSYKYSMSVFRDNGFVSGYFKSSNHMYYTTSYNEGSNTPSSVEEWLCQPVPSCQEGYTKGEDGNCYKCETGLLTLDEDGTYHCYDSCPSGSELHGGKCYSCAAGYSLVKEGGEYSCKKACPDDGYEVTEGSTLKCYTNLVNKVNKCSGENWVQDPNDPSKCRKLQLMTGNPVYVTCANGDLKNESAGKVCKNGENGQPFEPNSYDCDCFYDRCEDSELTLADAKVCPAIVTEKYRCGGTVLHPKYCYHTYNVTPIPKTTTLESGETVEIAGICLFTNSEGQTCGEAMGGWTLPNINQLYSIVDFDLYDPATAYPDLEYSRGLPNSTTCEKTESTYASCNPEDDDPCHDDYLDCVANKCVSIDPFGDLKCKADGSFLCIEGKCIRNNWFWSYNTVVSEKEDSAKFTWAVNMEDGRSYRALKGCVGEACAEDVDTTARRHRVICVKGSTLAGIFDTDAPALGQTFSGWACDKNDDEQSLAIYFEITDNSGSKKNVVSMLPASDYIVKIPGLGDTKGIKYGQTDIKPTSGSKANEIYNNCNFKSDPAPHAFEIKWNGEVTAGKEELAALIMSIENVQCSDEKITAYYNAVNSGLDTFPDISGCALPPYFVTAYGVNEASTTATALAIAPTERPFVLSNICGDGYQTFDGEYTENCENDLFNRVCGYNNSSCELCAREQVSKGGHVYEPCQKYPADPPKCGDAKVQSEYCENGVIADGHEGAGLACEKYNFAANNILDSSEQCDCGAGFYYYENSVVNCSYRLDKNICPDYNSGRVYGQPTIEDDFCYICVGCKKAQTERGYCGDGRIQRSDCSGEANCEEVAGANEECDDGGTANVDTGACKQDCTSAYCGDGFIQAALDEKCDSKDKNGHYETHCQSDDVKCPGCASVTCGIGGTDSLGPRCGDGKIQNIALCTANASTLAANGYANQADFFEQNGFEDVADCQAKLGGDNPAKEVCDLGVVVDAEGNTTLLNGKPVTFESFLDTPEAAEAGCFETINGKKFPVNAIHANFAECVYKYKEFVNNNPGCSADCRTKAAPYCGDVPVNESNPGDLATGEVCDNGLPNVEYKNGKYTIAAGTANYNGKAFGSCRLDCKGRYECNNGFVEKGADDCTGLTVDNYCPSIGSWSASDGYVIFVTGGWETCDEGDYNGTYGHCDSCKDVAKCGGENPKINEIAPGKFEECDFGDGAEGNKKFDEAYKAEYGKSCVAEEGCDGEYTSWGNKLCCVYGRYCGDGTVDNGLVNNDGVFKVWTGRQLETQSDGSKKIVYHPEYNWTLEGATVEYDTSSFALRFTLTEDADEDNPATAVFNQSFDIVPALRYFMELDLMLIPTDEEELAFDAGALEYSATGTTPLTSPFYFVDIENPSTEYISGVWYHGRNSGPIKGLGTAPDNWYPATEKAKVVFRMEGAEGTQFLVRSFSFYDLESVDYNSAKDGSEEMCDPGTENFKTASSYYMQDCQAGCKWINYCGDGTVQRSGSCGSDGKFNGYNCTGGIIGAAEVCDKGYSAGKTANIANTYNGCEPGCLELGPRCGDGRIDCPEGSTYYACGNYAKGMSASQQEQCDNGYDGTTATNNNTALSGNIEGATADNYGSCRTNCKFSRCGDGVFDENAYVEEQVPQTDDEGNIIYEKDPVTGDYIYINGERVPKMTNVTRYLEECDCGAAGSYDPAVTGNYQVDLNKDKPGMAPDMFYICRDGDREVYNSNTEKRKAVCRPNCTISRCGDGVLDTGANEECDDGNDNDNDSCKNDCTFNKCNDGVFAYTRSYLCEELINMTEPQLKDMAKKGIVDCGGTGQITCAALATQMTTASAVADKFDAGILHCCYDVKLREGGAGDGNCKFEYVNNSTLEKKRLTPKELAEQRCKDNALNYSIPDDDCNNAEQIERCEYCVDADCGCAKQYPAPRSAADKIKYETCLENNRYCIFSTSSPSRCWNIFGACGDGKIDEDAGEQCDNYKSGEQGEYVNLDGGEPQNGGTNGIGTYCTGLCSGSCGVNSPRCTEEGQLGCWKTGCDRKQHRNNNDITQGSSRCGDGNIDVYAVRKDSITGEYIQIEECDDGQDSHGSADEAYCSPTCKLNGTSCGDGTLQSKIESCDDGADNGTYCVNSCKTYYGKCGDGELHGPGYNLYDSKSPLSSGNNGSAGPEYCDFKEESGVFKGDARSVSLANAGITNFCSNCGVDTVPFTCGDKKRNKRFEGCDFGTGNNGSTIECTNAIKVSSTGTESDFGLCTDKSIGKKCYAGCKSDAIGGLIQAASYGIYGWACDPDHPMTHQNGFVILKFYNKNGAELSGSPLTLKTDWNFGISDDELKNGTDTQNYSISQNFTVLACGGGNKHGWFFDPSKASSVVFKNGPYTVKAYAKSIDDGETAEVLLGEKSFAMAMSCGDKEATPCSAITVQKTVYDSQGNATAQNEIWGDGKVCKDSELYGGKTCADYGLVNNQACKSEACDNGTGYNGVLWDCDASCQWTKCGDTNVQTSAGITPKPFSDYKYRPTGKAPEECEGSATKGCDTLFKNNKPADGISNDLQSDNAGCVADTCKWNVNNVCKVKSNCPALDTADMYVNNRDLYKKGVSNYIKYVNGGGNTPTYTRKWSGDYATGSWPAAETKVVYKDDAAADTPAAQCAFECVDGLEWENGKCVGKDDNVHNCDYCAADANGVWISPEGKACYGNSKTITYKTKINDSGDVVMYDDNGEYSTIETKYGTSDDGRNCIYKCPANSVYGADKVCHGNTLEHKCKTPSGAYQFNESEHRVWAKVWKDGDGHIQMSTLAQDDLLTIQRALNNDCGQPSVTCSYSPIEDDLVAVEINDADKGILKQKDILGDSESNLNRCFYTCAKDYKLNTAGTACVDANEGKQCGGNTVIHSEHCDLIAGTKMADGRGCRFTPGAHELCEDGSNNGKYGQATNGLFDNLSHCKKDCGASDEAAFLTCVAQHPTDYKTVCGDGKYGRIYDSTNSKSEYFCGDGKVQYSGSCSGVNCKPLSDYNTTYVDTTSSGFPGNEQCDDGETNTRKKLCDRWLTMNGKSTGSSYHDIGTISCSSCSISGGSTTNCAFCGDGTLQTAKEGCDIASNGEIMTAKGNYGKSCNSTTISASGTTSKSTTWEAPATGRYKIEVYGGSGGKGNGGSDNGCGGAKVWGSYDLTKGDTLTIVAGGTGSQGASNYGGQGGTASVVLKGSTLWMVAGGGGGGGWSGDYTQCTGGQASNSGAAAGGNSGGTGGGDGGGSSYGVGGTGWNNRSNNIMQGGSGGHDSSSYCNGTHNYAMGGGGGGYSGGAGSGSNDTGGGGGGSYYAGYVSGTNGWTTEGNSKNAVGKVVITQTHYKPCSSCTLSSTLTTCIE